MPNFSDRLKDLRAERRLQQKEVAEAVEIGISTYQLYEYGKSRPKQAIERALATFFGVSVEYLRGESDDRRPSLALNDARSEYNTRSDDYELHAHRDAKTEGIPLGDALSLVTQLERLAKLHDDGKITDEEYSILKGKIIRG